MDEPTSALSGNEVEVLFRVIRELTASGVAVVYISHHLEEALEIADHAVVFRDGALVASGDAGEIDINWVISHMVGRSAEGLAPDLRDEFGHVALSVRGLKVADPTNPSGSSVDGITIEVREGEVVCLYGLMGAGRTELLEALAGRLPLLAGEVRGPRSRDLERVDRRPDLTRHDACPRGPSTRRSRPDHVGRPQHLTREPRVLRHGDLAVGPTRGLAVESTVRDVRVKTESARPPSHL